MERQPGHFPRRRHMVGVGGCAWLGSPPSSVVPPHWALLTWRLAKAWPALPFSLGRVSKAASRRAEAGNATPGA